MDDQAAQRSRLELTKQEIHPFMRHLHWKNFVGDQVRDLLRSPRAAAAPVGRIRRLEIQPGHEIQVTEETPRAIGVVWMVLGRIQAAECRGRAADQGLYLCVDS